MREVSNLVYKGLVLSFDGRPVHAGAGGRGRAIASWGASEHGLQDMYRWVHMRKYIDINRLTDAHAYRYDKYFLVMCKYVPNDNC